MLRKVRISRHWHRLSTNRWVMSFALVALLVGSAVGFGAFGAFASQPLSSRPGHSIQGRPVLPTAAQQKAQAQALRQRYFGKTQPPADYRAKALKQAAKLPVSPIALHAQPVTGSTAPHVVPPHGAWMGLGPASNQANGCTSMCPFSGQISAIAVDPNDANSIWIGSANGGVWHSTDAGSTWSPMTDQLATMAIASIAIDGSTTPSTIYIGTGTGSPFYNVYQPMGVYESADNGQTWNSVGSNQPFSYDSVVRLVIDPANSQVLYAAVASSYYYGDSNTGVWRFDGVQWSQLLTDYVGSPTYQGDGATDIVFDPADATGKTIFAALASWSSSTSGAGVYETTDGGAHWNPLTTGTNGLPTGSAVFAPVSLGISTDGTKVYVGANGTSGSIYVSTNSGSTFASETLPSDLSTTGITTLAVDPTDATGNTVYIGTYDLWQRTVSGGNTTYTDLTTAAGAYVGNGVDSLAFFGSAPASVYVGNYVGIWSVTNGGTFSDLNGGGLSIDQMYAGSIGDQGTDAQLYGVSREAGTEQYPAGPVGAQSAWTQVDYAQNNVVVDWSDNSIVYDAYYGANFGVSTDGGQTWYAASNGINQADNTSLVPFVMSPTTHTELFAGTDRVYKTTSAASSWATNTGSWTPISGVLDTRSCWGVTGGCPLDALAVAPSHDATIYAGSDFGKVFATTNGGTNWNSGVQVNPSACFTYGSTTYCAPILALAVDPTNSQVVYAALPNWGYGSIGQMIFKSTDGGAHWSDISKPLPQTYVTSLAVDPANHNLLLASTEVGVFASPDAGGSWFSLNTGLPNVIVNQLFFTHGGNELFAATQGRGMWELTAPHFDATPAAVTAYAAPSTTPPTKTFSLQNNGVTALNFSLTSTLPSWINSVTPTSGTIATGSSQTITVTFNALGGSPQTYQDNLTFTDTNADNSPFNVPVFVDAPNVSTQWYFAEGYTGGSFSEYLTLANPNAVAANVQVQYFLAGGGSPITKNYVVNPQSRLTKSVNQEIGNGQSVSMVVTSDQPVVAERPMYFTYTGLHGYTIPGGSDVLGATQLSTNFDFGYLDTTSGHATWLTILNQNGSPMTVSIHYFAANGTETDKTHTVAANSRGTVYVNGEGLPAGSYSALVSLSEPGLVERPLYLKDGITGYTGSADVVGVANPASAWYFAEGYTSGTFNERYIVSNPNASGTASVTVTYLRSDGTTATNFFTLGPGQQHVFSANAALGNGVNNSATVTATGDTVLAERFISFKYGSLHIQGASDVLGATMPTNLFYFAEGFTGGSFSEYLTIENPDPSATAWVTVTYLPSNGSAPTVQTFPVAPSSRYTVFTNSVMPKQAFSMVVESSSPIVAERPMYFIYATTQTGGSDVVGYQP